MNDDSGPAFPVGNGNVTGWGVAGWGSGMTLRDWFAGQALIGLMAGDRDVRTSPAQTAYIAYELARAMLVERAK